MRSDRPSAFIDPLRRLARNGGRLLLNGLATRASAVGGLPDLLGAFAQGFGERERDERKLAGKLLARGLQRELGGGHLGAEYSLDSRAKGGFEGLFELLH